MSQSEIDGPQPSLAGSENPYPRRATSALGRHRRVAGFAVAAALLSAVVSSAGTFALISLTRPAAVADAGRQQLESQRVDLTVSEAIVRVALAARPSVVTITAAGVAGAGSSALPAAGSGSGFVVRADGLILTNNHVISGASSLIVSLADSRSVPATVVTADPAHDLALIKVSVAGLTPVTLGDSDAVRGGQLAIAIGSPLGTFTDSVTQGIVSGINRTATVGDGSARTERNLTGLIQTDAAINAGNSGGPLLDAGGSVVGVVTASVGGSQGVGFAVPINQAKAMISAATK